MRGHEPQIKHCSVGLGRFLESESQRAGSFAIFEGGDSGIGSFLSESQCRDSFLDPQNDPAGRGKDQKNLTFHQNRWSILHIMLSFHKRSWSRCGIWDSNSFYQGEPELELESLFEESAQA